MEFERKKQSLLLEGVRYTVDDLHLLKAKAGGEQDASSIQMLFDFLQEWFADSPFMIVHTSGSTGEPKKIMVGKDKMMQSARLTCEFLNLQAGDAALLCMNLRYIGAHDGSSTLFGGRTESDSASCFRSSSLRYKRTAEICGNGSFAGL